MNIRVMTLEENMVIYKAEILSMTPDEFKKEYATIKRWMKLYTNKILTGKYDIVHKQHEKNKEIKRQQRQIEKATKSLQKIQSQYDELTQEEIEL